MLMCAPPAFRTNANADAHTCAVTDCYVRVPIRVYSNAALDLEEAGRLGVFTPMFLCTFQKPKA